MKIPAMVFLYKDHPRSRGEYGSHVRGLVGASGSSPLSRGIPHTCPQPLRRERIIPALAGNTGHSERLIPHLPDHPRSRGEYYLETSPGPRIKGSSPLSRGIRAVTAPAPAAAVDHPRSRGEYHKGHETSLWKWGSSPLSRGIPQHNADTYAALRIIPALAGNTMAGPRSGVTWWDHPRSRGEYRAPPTPRSSTLGSSPLSRGIPGLRFPGTRT